MLLLFIASQYTLLTQVLQPTRSVLLKWNQQSLLESYSRTPFLYRELEAEQTGSGARLPNPAVSIPLSFISHRPYSFPPFLQDPARHKVTSTIPSHLYTPFHHITPLFPNIQRKKESFSEDFAARLLSPVTHTHTYIIIISEHPRSGYPRCTIPSKSLELELELAKQLQSPLSTLPVRFYVRLFTPVQCPVFSSPVCWNLRSKSRRWLESHKVCGWETLR